MDLFGHEDPEDRLARERQMSYASHEEIKRAIEACHRCHLRDEGGLGPVLSTGPADAPLMIVGEGPGRVEDDYGGPLIGPSGQLLDKALEDRPGVVRARPGLGVELDRPGVEVGEVEPLDGAVVERHVRRLGAL